MTLLQLGDTLDGMTSVRPAPEWTPPPTTPGTRKSQKTFWTGIMGSLLALLALGISIIAITKTPASGGPVSTPSTVAGSTTPNDIASAKARVCSTFTQVVDSLKYATSQPDGDEPFAVDVNARAAIVAGALALTRSISDATPSDVRDAANTLSDSYVDYALALFAGGSGDKAPVAAAIGATRQACNS